MVELILLFFILLSLAALVGTIMAAIEIATKPFKRDKDKVIWLIIVLLLGGIGPIIYYFNRSNLLAKPKADDREYLPPLKDRQAGPQVQSRSDNQDDYV
ncbi:MAG: hypothetical protein ACI81P_000732 [Neolewinella sp.]|jgi:hypothetical protein